MTKFELSYVCQEFEVPEDTIYSWIECHLIEPAEVQGPLFDEEDLARIKLLIDLKNLYNTNNESLEVILHLVDQIHHLNLELNKRS